MNVGKLAKAIADARDKAFAESSAGKTANQMQELCRELVGALRGLVVAFEAPATCEGAESVMSAMSRAYEVIAKSPNFNPTPAPNGCVETAATVPACVGTGETDKALGVGPVCPVCGCDEWDDRHKRFACQGWVDDVYCEHVEHLAITRAKQLAEAEAVLATIEEKGGFGMGGSECGEKAADYFRNKTKEPTA